MTIALINTNEKTKDWHDALEKELGQTIEIWPDIKDKSKIEFAIVSAPPEGAIAELPNLKAVQSLWAGVEHITGDASFPKHLPIIRMVDIGLTEGMQEYVTAQVLFHHLNMPKYVQDQRNTAWQPINPPLARHRKVAMLGLGHLGVACAKMLSDVGFKMLGWSRSQKTISGIDCFAGADGLDEVLREAEIIVNLLPNTPETTKLFDAEKFSKCRRGVAFVNPGRGTVFDDQALIDAMDSGQVSAV
ncbi:MAG: glyoxylate/hydroxypyruvate reductase A, partial [Alphaproteobacteria bacterium]|nr:glyoxylate/hydroxypyruvate reductase A [Alphaproteobacteria bacterium]